MPIVTDAAQIAGFLLAGWLLFRFTDWIYRRNSRVPPAAGREDPAGPVRSTTADPATTGARGADHGGHGPRSPAQLPGDGARRAPANAARH